MRLSLSLGLGLALLSYPALAEPLSPVKTAELSARLFATGLELRDPLLILSAAKLRKMLNPAEADRSAEGGETTAGESPLNWQEMLEAAEPLAAGDDTLVSLIADIRAENTKGVATGPVYNIGKLANGRSDSYPKVDFIGGEYAEVYVEAKGAADLNLTVTDAQGRLVCSDTDRSHIAYCGWRPDRTEPYLIRVENRGPNGVSYALMTN